MHSDHSRHHSIGYQGEYVCKRKLLALVARGNIIITELHRLIGLVPSPYKCRNEEQIVSSEIRKTEFVLDDIIYDFSYFKDSQSHENKIEANVTLKKADEEFCDNFIEVLTRFYLTFESLQRYSSDLNNFIKELEEDSFVGQSLDGLLVDTEGCQLLCEAYFLLGYMLITVDNNFEGGLRERLIVSYYRYSSYKSSPGSSLDETCNLMRSTGFRSLQQQAYKASHATQIHRPESYPESFFSRVGVNQSIISLLIAKLQSTEIYDQSVITFPHPDHRSTLLSKQASMLYVILYFCPSILHDQRARMREIADKFFYDNWIISVHMGELVNLIEAWEPYKAARESLSQLIEVESVQSLIKQNNLKFSRVSKQLSEYLKEGWLDDNSFLDNHVRILIQIREANVLLKWFMIHSQLHSDWHSKLTRYIYSIVIKGSPDRAILFRFLQNLSELEKKFIELCETILAEKDNRIVESKTRANETLNDLIDILSDTKPMRWIQADTNTKLVDLLSEFALKLNSIEFDGSNARDLIINLINDIEIAQEAYLSGKNLQTIQLFTETKEHLMLILKLISLTSDVKVSVHSISNFSYAWRIMDVTFTTHMQQMIKDNPLKAHGIESTFLKLSSAYKHYLLRLQQNNSNDDLDSVTQYHSKKLVSYIRDVLHIIPASILELVSSIIAIQTKHFMRDIPAKVSLDNLKDYALPAQRFQMLELTHKISHYAESMLMMQNTTVGLVKINSKQLLEDGIRRELVKRMSDSIRDFIVQQRKSRTSQTMTISQQAQCLLSTLEGLHTIMNGYKCSFNYLQDYLFIYGLRMWQEELNRLIKFNVELVTEAITREWCSHDRGFQTSALGNNSSIYQSSNAPIPVYSSDPLKSSFIWLIFNDMLRVTDPRATIYDEQMNAWYDQKLPHDKIVDLNLFELLVSSLSVTGLNGIDQMCGVLIMVELQKLDTYLISINSSYSKNLLQILIGLCDSIEPQQKLQSSDGFKLIEKSFSSAVIKMAPYSEKVVNHLLHIGQLQAIRTSISCVLSTKCRYEARNIYSCLSTLNTTLLSTLKEVLLSQQRGAELDPDANKLNSYNTADSDGSKSSSEDWDLAGGLDANSNSNANNNLEDSQLIVELANHLDWIGLSDPLSKIYTLALQAVSGSSKNNEFREQLVAVDQIFLVLLDQCSKFQFSQFINGFVPKQSRSFYEVSHNADGQPLFYGILTLINHYEPFLHIVEDKTIGTCNDNKPLKRLLNLMSLYIRWSFLRGNQSSKSNEFSSETTNMISSLLELIRLIRQPAGELLSDICLPKFIFDTFQFTA